MKYRTLITVFFALCLGLLTACGGSPTLANSSLTYEDIKGSGLANLCPELPDTSLGAIAIDGGRSYQLKELCLQPSTFLVKQAPLMKRQDTEFIPTKLLTRESFTLDQVNGSLERDANGHLTFVESGGFDFQPVTVQLPDGERVPLLFTIKDLIAQSQNTSTDLGPSTQFVGTFKVPPYRTSSFIDPKGRGLAVGYDAAVGLPPQADREDLARQNIKTFEVNEGRILMQVNRVNRATGEISGIFESEQPSDTDFGAKESMEVKIQGQFYGRIEDAIA